MKTKAENNTHYSLLLNLLLILLGSNLNAQTRIDFTPRTSVHSPLKKTYKLKGDFTIIGNTNQVHENSGGNSAKRKVVAVDLDNDPSTSNSSSATLVFPEENNTDHECSDIVFAGLYWSGRTSVDVNEIQKREIKLKYPGQSSYRVHTAKKNDIQYKGHFNIYVGYTEVTDSVKKYGLGEYWLADMALTEGLGDAGFYGGWGMVVVYRNSNMHSRYITVLDGYAFLTGGNSTQVDFPVDGFNTPGEGPIHMKVGLMAGEGDDEIDGDIFQIKNNNDNTWLNLTHAGNSADNFFNSSIQTGGNQRQPLLSDNVGIDICMFEVPNVGNSIVANNQSSATFRCNSSRDSYAIFALAMSVNSYFLLPEGYNQITHVDNQPVTDPAQLQPGEKLDLKLEIKNKGTESIDKLKIEIPIPYNVELLDVNGEVLFSPNEVSTQPVFDPDRGEFGTIIWDFGQLPVHENREDLLATINYTMKLTQDCGILTNSTCKQYFSIGGVFSGVGSNSLVEFDDIGLIRGFQDDNTCDVLPIEEPIKVNFFVDDFAAANCANWEYGRIINFPYAVSSIPVNQVSDYFPPGSKFFNEFPLSDNFVEYNASNPFPAINNTYYAIPPDNESCSYKFTIIVDIVSVSEIENLSYCQNDQVSEIEVKTSNPVYKPFFFTSPLSENPIESLIPPTDRPGLSVYYVAEGIDKDRYGPKVSFEVWVYPRPEANAGFDQEICLGDSAQIGSLPKAGNEYLWYSDPPGFSSTRSNPTVNPTVSTQYSVIETITETGCADTAFMNSGIKVYPVPTAQFSSSADVVLMENPGIQFTNESNEASSYLWSFGDNSGLSAQESPYHIYNNIGNFDVNLVATNSAGCSDTAMNSVTVTFTELYPPTAFSPLSSNPANRVFKINDENILDENYRLQIFNRWGETVYESTTKTNYWDGTMENGKPAPAGVYVWILDYTDFVGVARSQKGSITLLYQEESASGKLHLPTAFSPNSTIVEDREFKIDSTGLVNEHFNLQVFNRWGSLVFESKSIETGWKGEALNGSPAPAGTYIYRLLYSDLKGIRYKQQGSITLIY